MGDNPEIVAVQREFEVFKPDIVERLGRFTDSWEKRLDEFHAENRSRLQDIEKGVRATQDLLAGVASDIRESKVKTDALYGSPSGAGSVNDLAKRVERLDKTVTT